MLESYGMKGSKINCLIDNVFPALTCFVGVAKPSSNGCSFKGLEGSTTGRIVARYSRVDFLCPRVLETGWMRVVDSSQGLITGEGDILFDPLLVAVSKGSQQ